MSKRYVIFRVFSKNKFANIKEVTKGEILGSYSSIEDIARSEHFHSESQIELYLKAVNTGVRQPNNGKITYEEAEKEMLEASIGLIQDRMERTGVMHNIETKGMHIDDIKKLLTLTFGGRDEPVSFILLDLQYKNDIFCKKEKKWFREINLINLTE